MSSLPPCSEDELFALFDSALLESLGEREPAAPPLDLDPRTHVCAGSCCPYVVLNEAHTLVCSLTGVCHGQAAARNDPFCAGIVQRVDEHGLLKGPVQRFVKRDFLLAQRRAVLLAHELDRMESENPKSAEIKAPVPRPRAAEFLSSASGTRLTGTAARMARGPVMRPELREDALANLRVRAERVLDSLTEPAVAVLRERAQRSTIAQPEAPPVPPEAAAYLRRCVLQGQTPSLDTVHNLCLAHEHDCLRRARADALLRDLAARGRGYQALRALVAQLVVALWKSALKSPSMITYKRPSDHFLQFASAVLLGLRRGFRAETTAGPVQLVPTCALLALAMQHPRNAPRAAVEAAKAVHLKAHKGTSYLHACVRSVPVTDRAAHFEAGARAAEALSLEARGSCERPQDRVQRHKRTREEWFGIR
jgi:hypothetical protein